MGESRVTNSCSTRYYPCSLTSPGIRAGFFKSANAMNSNWTLFKYLCRIIGGQDRDALLAASRAGLFPKLMDIAAGEDLLPALATRVEEQADIEQTLDEPERQLLRQALQHNTRRNMHTVMQALKLARTLNGAGITPTFLKGTAQLLTVNEARLGFRKQLDIDLVVAPEEMKDACAALLEAGYGFYRESGDADSEPVVFHDVTQALQESAAHHHVTPLVIEGYPSCVEVHRHFLARQFQRDIPLEGLLSTARLHESHGAAFRVPHAQYQVIHIVLGKMVYDGHLSRRSFPIREACDYIELLGSETGEVDWSLVAQHCRKNYTIFSQLVSELMAYRNEEGIKVTHDISRRLKLMEKRYNSGAVAKLLYTNARTQYLASEMIHSPTKLAAYLQRLGRG